ncbi:MAG: hypothetical protein BWY55_00700 [archaeon ADurb.Bin336]|nr:MAG: hypothetical protein BWY55_00700 [archaeon ADurb.Bin336]
MVIKSKKAGKSKAKSKPKRSVKSTTSTAVKSNRSTIPAKSVSNESFFQRMKEIIKSEMPKPEKVRVKTFIVEKPVIIRDNVQRIDSDSKEVFDSRRSRYGRGSIATGLGLVKEKKKPIEKEVEDENEFADEAPVEDDFGADEDYSNEEDFSDSQSEDDFQEGVEGESDQLEEEYPVEELPKKRIRSRGMFNNIWWKKALFWSILVWLFILAIEMAMHVMKLVTIDLTRQWWVLLGIIILIGMVYFRFIDGKFVF